MTEQLTLKYIPLSTAQRWERNPKKHDIGALVQSIELHGFRDPPAYDAQLDAFVEGNGRTEALMWMFAEGRETPRGIGALLDEQGNVIDWAIPVLFGVDAKSKLAAEAYGVDHNNLTLSGGDFTVFDMARQWDASYYDLVRDIAANETELASMNGDAIDALLHSALANGSQIDLGHSSEASSGFAEGEQFSTSYAAIIALSDEQANDQELKLDLQRWCDEHGLTYKVGKR